jgi:uncharacterized protein (DUF983 family)
MIRRRLSAILRQRCPVCLEGPMYSGLVTMYERCPQCSHQFERETGFFQGAMYVSWVTSVGLFATIALLARLLLAPRIGLLAAMAVAVLVYMPCVPMLFRYSRVIWAHMNIGTRIPPA